MGEIKKTGGVHHPERSTSTKTKGISSKLMKLQEATNRLVTTGRFASALGAGKPPQISDRPPTKSAKRTAQAVEGTLTRPTKKHRS